MLASRQHQPGTCYAVIPYRNYYDSSNTVNTIIQSPQHFRNISLPALPLSSSLSPLSPLSPSLLLLVRHPPTALSTRPCTSRSLAYTSPP